MARAAPASHELGYIQITSLAAVKGVGTLTAEQQKASAIFIAVEGEAIRFRADGSNPTTAVGIPMAAGEKLFYTTDGAQNLKVIEQAGGGTAKVNVALFS